MRHLTVGDAVIRQALKIGLHSEATFGYNNRIQI